MQVMVKVRSLRHLVDVAGLDLAILAHHLQCSNSLACKKLYGQRKWFRAEVDILVHLLEERGTVTISRQRLEELIGKQNIRNAPVWSPRPAEVTGMEVMNG
jgi:hypothetical protein